MKHMDHIGIRELKQNASAVVARVAAGETVTITDRRRAVAQLAPLSEGRVAQLVATGRARAPKHSLATLDAPSVEGELASTLRQMRDDERY